MTSIYPKVLIANLSVTILFLGSAGAAQAANIIVNGDFETGNIGFSSDYQYLSPSLGEGHYAIGTNPNSVHSLFASFGDHTTGTGNMMIVNGSTLPNQTVWQQTIDVSPNTEYNFAAWIASAFSGEPAELQPAELQFSINSTSIGDIFTAPTTLGNWEEFNATWNSGSNTQATVSIVDLSLAYGGNDFALDDISMEAASTPVPEPLTILGSTTALGVGALLKREHSRKQKKKASDR
jgi:hypothetical protein